jgi:aldehyde dehydrogenase (NAD+)
MTASPVDATTVQFNPETRLYIDGRLRDSSTHKTVDNVNPATEEVLGTCTDAGAEDMEQAIAAARRAFDTTDWSTDHEFRKHCLLQLHNALQEEKEDIRAELIAEVGSTVGMTYIAQLEWPLADAVRWPAEYISKFAWQRMLEQDAKMGVPYNRVVVKEAMPDSGDRKHHGAQAGDGDALERVALGPDHRREDRHPARCGEYRSGV